MWISHRYTYIPSLLNFLPISHPIPPFWVDTEPLFEFPESHSKFPLAIYFTYGNASFLITSFHASHPLLPSSQAHKSIPYICFSTAKSLQSCPTLCDPTDCSLPGSPVPGSLQARTLEWVAISFSNACKWKVKVKSLSRVRLLAAPWTAACQAPLSMGFSRQEYWSGVPLPSPFV